MWEICICYFMLVDMDLHVSWKYPKLRTKCVQYTERCFFINSSVPGLLCMQDCGSPKGRGRW